MTHHNMLAIAVAAVGSITAFGAFYWLFDPPSLWQPYSFAFVVFAYCEYVTNDLLDE